MARTKGFDPDAAVTSAMETFWTGGYAATSTQDLVDALGLNRSSLYGTFGSKDELYRQALRRYAETAQAWSKMLLEGPGPLRSRLAAALFLAIEPDLDRANPRGCFACNAAVEVAPADAAVRRLVTTAFGAVREDFRAALVRAREEGELTADADVDGLASLLVAVLEGLHVLAKGTRDPLLLNQAIEAAVAAV